MLRSTGFKAAGSIFCSGESGLKGVPGVCGSTPLDLRCRVIRFVTFFFCFCPRNHFLRTKLGYVFNSSLGHILSALLYRARAPPFDDTSTEEFLAMTFVHGPEGVTFSEDKPAKIRFFLGCVDDLAPTGDGADQASFFFTM